MARIRQPRPSSSSSSSLREKAPGNPSDPILTTTTTTTTPPPHQPNHECGEHDHERQRRAMDKFRALLFKFAESASSSSSFNSKPLPPAQKLLIDQRLRDFFPDLLHTPNHPPYAAMIERALAELNEEGGSSEESISNFIRKEYKDLAWAHVTLLKHHLEKLCETGDIVLGHGNCYLLADASGSKNPNSNPSHTPTPSCTPVSRSSLNLNPRRERLKRKRRLEQGRGRGKRRKKDLIKDKSGPDEVIEEENEPDEEQQKVIEVIEEQLQLQGQHEVVEEQNQTEELENVVIKSKPQPQEQGDGISDKLNDQQQQEKVACKEHKQMEGKNQLQEEQIQVTGEQNKQSEQQNEVVAEQAQQQELEVQVVEEQDWQRKQEVEEAEEEQQEDKQNEATEEENQVGKHHKARMELSQSCDDDECVVSKDLIVMLAKCGRPMIEEGKNFFEEKWEQQTKSRNREMEFFNTCGELAQKELECPSPESSPQLKMVEELSWTQDQQQVEEGRPHHGQLYFQPPEPKTSTTMAKMLPTRYQPERHQPDCDGQGRLLELKPVAVTVEELSMLDHQHQDGQGQPARRGRGRPPKVKAEAAAIAKVLSTSECQHNSQQQQEELPKRRGRGRPRKCEQSTVEKLGSSQKKQQTRHQGRGRRRKLD